jgi:hypothetical protein
MVSVELPPLPVSGFEVYETVNNPEFKTSSASDDKFVALNGKTKEIAYYDGMLKNSFDEDYDGISNTGSVSFTEIDSSRFYKGKKVCLKKANHTGKTLEWDDLESCLLGFISEITFTVDGVDVKLVGMSKLLEQEKEFSFTKTKRSKILKEIIETAGLKADIVLDGLKDDVISYTNVSSSGGGSNNYNITGEIADVAHQICEGLTTEYDKAYAIWKYCHDNFKYVGYSGSLRGAEGCFKKKGGNCCDHANVVVKMLRAENIKAAYKHSSGCYGGKGHVWACAYCEGKWYDIDASVKSRGFNQVGQGCTGSRQESINF